jgi:HAD superfamily hydrolase (TIGR01549 family)
MAKKSISDLNNFSLFIFDLDNTIYNEEDYLFQAYSAICDRFSEIAPEHDKKSLLNLMMKIYREEGRDKLFDKFLVRSGIGEGYLSECLKILRTFNPEKQIEIYSKSEEILRFLIEKDKKIFVLTNGNPGQQKNKIRNLVWHGFDEKITFIMANEIEPKPSPAGIIHILEITGIEKNKTLFIGDSHLDQECASSGEIKFINIADLNS